MTPAAEVRDHIAARFTPRALEFWLWMGAIAFGVIFAAVYYVLHDPAAFAIVVGGSVWITSSTCRGLRLSISDHTHAIASSLRIIAAHPGTPVAAGNLSQIVTRKQPVAELRRDLAIHLRDADQKDAS